MTSEQACKIVDRLQQAHPEGTFHEAKKTFIISLGYDLDLDIRSTSWRIPSEQYAARAMQGGMTPELVVTYAMLAFS